MMVSNTNEHIEYLQKTPLNKLSDADVDFAIDYFGDFDGWRFKIERRRRNLIAKFTEMLNQPLTKKDYDFLEKRLLETFDELTDNYSI